MTHIQEMTIYIYIYIYNKRKVTSSTVANTHMCFEAISMEKADRFPELSIDGHVVNRSIPSIMWTYDIEFACHIPPEKLIYVISLDIFHVFIFFQILEYISHSFEILKTGRKTAEFTVVLKGEPTHDFYLIKGHHSHSSGRSLITGWITTFVQSIPGLGLLDKR